MILPLTLAILLAGLTSSAVAFEDPTHFRGVPWGASEAELRGKLSGEQDGPEGRWSGIGTCRSHQGKFRWAGDRSCDGVFYLGSMLVQADYGFRGDRFSRVLLTFRPDDFDEVERIFLERYGPPTGQADLPIRTGAGAELMNRTLKWNGALVLISLQRYLGKITESGATLTTVEDDREAARLRGQDAKEAAKGL